MEIILPLAQEYSEKITSAENELLKEISDFTYAHHAQPHMLSGQVQGRLLAALSRMISPTCILEIGTFTGYSALCLAEGLKPGGELHTLEKNPDDVKLSKSYFERSPWKEQIFVHEGDALQLIPGLQKSWDLVFIDADKPNYINYYEAVLPLLRKGAWIIADNVFFHGQVLDAAVSGKNAIAIHAFNEHIKSDLRVEQVMLTVRDGLLVIRKK